VDAGLKKKKIKQGLELQIREGELAVCVDGLQGLSSNLVASGVAVLGFAGSARRSNSTPQCHRHNHQQHHHNAYSSTTPPNGTSV
jgi:hypothetical protein